MIKEKASPIIEEQEAENSCAIHITVGEEEPIELERYLIGVIAAEMPASFNLEALKAQAIASRTYAVHQTNFGQTPIKATTAHQVFASPEQRQQKWLTTFQQYEAKIEQAVVDTKGQIILYDEQPISAMFHASSAGLTESAFNYSGNAIPYLQSVKSSEPIESESKDLTFAELNQALSSNLTASDFQSVRLQRNSTGRVETVQFGEKTWSGRDFRERLQLRSTTFTITAAKNGLAIVTKGYGHGVGMSQYGANDMAEKGATAEEIVAHYYPTTTLDAISCPQNEEF